ncbi:DUF739 family protein [Neofamilia massiliensis]|uniref:DUF739 family protein n=1 Tax=Neofamilia massiliensis TaxID=1673724 RepID=UPI0006BB88BC|nr:DUF739 family protein [Neofamilia massiliensis]
MNPNKLKAKMVECGDTQVDLAKAIGISASRLNLKINNNAQFRQEEIVAISERYKLTAIEIGEIFFNTGGVKCQD